jgi:hypothetical protein
MHASTVRPGRRLIGTLCLLGGMLSFSHHSLARTSADANWTGTVTVIAQSGDACAYEPKPPYQRKVMASGALSHSKAGLIGRLFISGDTEAIEASGKGGAFALRPLLGNDDVPGTLLLSWQNGLIKGRWSETPSAREGMCSWTDARIELVLESVKDGARNAKGRVLVEQLFRLAQRLRQVGVTDGPEFVTGLATMVRLGEDLAGSGLGNLAAARLFLDQSDLARLFGRRQESLAMIKLSSQLHRRVAGEHPLAVAEALSREASALRSMRRRSEAALLYHEALTVLAAANNLQTSTGSSVYNSLGALYLIMTQYDDAVHAFKLALDTQQQWGAPAPDVSGTLNNLAHALLKQGHKAAALKVFDDALSRLSGNSDRERSLAALIRENASAVRGPDSQPIELEG